MIRAFTRPLRQRLHDFLFEGRWVWLHASAGDRAGLWFMPLLLLLFYTGACYEGIQAVLKFHASFGQPNAAPSMTPGLSTAVFAMGLAYLGHLPHRAMRSVVVRAKQVGDFHRERAADQTHWRSVESSRTLRGALPTAPQQSTRRRL